MPIRLAQVGAFGYDPAHVRLPRTLLEFQHLFPDETTYARYLERIRWPEGFECPSCRQARPRVLECRQCGHQVSLIRRACANRIGIKNTTPFCKGV